MTTTELPSTHGQVSPAPTRPSCPTFNLHTLTTTPWNFALLAAVRQQTPVFFEPQMGAWVVSTFADCVTVLRDHECFSASGMIVRTRNYSPQVLAALGNGAELMSAVMLNLDPPAHTHLRSAVHKSFTPRRVAAFQSIVRDLMHAQIDELGDCRQGDVAELIGLPVATKAICRLVGLPDAMYTRVRTLCDDLQEFSAAYTSEERLIECARSACIYRDLISDLIDQRLADPQEDLASDVLQATQREEDPLTRTEALATISSIVLASFFGVADAFHNILYWLLHDRQHWQRILDDRSLIPAMVEEGLRFDGTTMGVFRFTTQPVTLSGVEIPAGEPVYAMVGAANHDEAQFDSPDQIDPHRANAARNLTFGYGIHHCVGAPLARLKLSTMLDVLCERLPNLRLSDPDTIEFRYKFTRTLGALPATW